MNIKTNIFEELNKMKNLITVKAGTVISEQANNINTDIQTIKTELDKGFANSDEQKIVDVLKKYTSDKPTLQNFLNQYKTVTGTVMTSVLPNVFQRGRDDKEVEDLNSSLLKLGVKLDLIFDNKTRKVNAVFTGLDTPAAATNTDDLWKTTYSCVPSQPGAKPINLKDGTTAYLIGKVYYYNSGRKKLENGTLASYNCNTEFRKLKSQPTISSRFAKSVATLGIQNGKIDVPTLQTILNQLNSRQL